MEADNNNNIAKANIRRGRRKILSVAQKLNIVNRLNKGERSKDICAAFNLSSSTVRTIYVNRDKILDIAQSSASSTHMFRVTKSRDGVLERVEKLLLQWIDSHGRDETVLNYSAVRDKALTLFNELKKKTEVEGSDDVQNLQFKASHGWFERFKRRSNLHVGTRRKKRKALAGDSVSVQSFRDEIQEIVDNGGYASEQIFSIDEIGLFWKKIPYHIEEDDDESRPPGFRDFNERLSVLLGSNLTGSVKLKPLLVHCPESKTSDSFDDAKMYADEVPLPVVCYWNNKLRVDYQIFTHYLTTYVSPLVESHCKQNVLENKSLLILDNCPWYPRNIEDIVPNIRAVFLPPSTGSDLHPLKQGIGATFKALYLKDLMEDIASNVDMCWERDVIMFLQKFKLTSAVDKISSSWDQIEDRFINFCWKNVLPTLAQSRSSSVTRCSVDKIHENIARLCKEVGFCDIVKDDVDVVTAYNGIELTNEQLKQLLENKPGEVEEINGSGSLDDQTLSTVFELAGEMCRLLRNKDPDNERSSIFEERLKDILSCYKKFDREEIKIEATTSENGEEFIGEWPTCEPGPDSGDIPE